MATTIDQLWYEFIGLDDLLYRHSSRLYFGLFLGGVRELDANIWRNQNFLASAEALEL